MNNNNALQQIMQGGACNPDGSQMSHSSNPVRNFMQNVFLGRGAVNEKINQYQYYPGENVDQIPTMPHHNLDKEWDMATQQMKNTHISGRDMERMMNEQWHAEQMRFEEEKRMQAFMHNQAWGQAQQDVHRREQEEIRMHKEMGDHWKNAELQHEAMGWGNDFLTEEYKNMEKEMQAAYADAEDIINRKEDEGKVVKEASNYMIDVMQSDPDPRFQNSKLLNFLKKLETGQYEIKENQLVDNGPQMGEMENAWEGANMERAWQDEEHKVDHGFAPGEEETNKVFDNIWKKMQAGEYNNDEEMLEAEYKKVLEKMENMGEGNFDDMFADVWNVEQDVEEYQAFGEVPAAYNFSNENPYANDPEALKTASGHLNTGKVKDAILALEAHVQQHPEDSNAWRVLGKLHMDNDQDRPAVRCLLNSVNIDPKNLDNLLALGVSCTNILDEVQAMNHLKHWMMNNPKYAGLPIDPEIIPESMVGKSISIDEIKQMNARLLDHFEKARMANPQDPELATGLAVLYFVARDYQTSVGLFNEAVKFDPNNYSLWNKLGATLAHLGRADEAIEAYNRALEFKPNYVRAWVNLGIAHAYKGEFDEAARFYLSALSMNPDARHVWSYLQTTLLSLQRYDLLKMASEHNLEAFKKEFDIVLPEDLPPPEIEYKLLTEQFLVKERSEDWVKDFAK